MNLRKSCMRESKAEKALKNGCWITQLEHTHSESLQNLFDLFFLFSYHRAVYQCSMRGLSKITNQTISCLLMRLTTNTPAREAVVVRCKHSVVGKHSLSYLVDRIRAQYLITVCHLEATTVNYYDRVYAVMSFLSPHTLQEPTNRIDYCNK